MVGLEQNLSTMGFRYCKIRVGDYLDFIVEDVVPPSIYDELADFRLRFISWIPVANEQVKSGTPPQNTF